MTTGATIAPQGTHSRIQSLDEYRVMYRHSVD